MDYHSCSFFISGPDYISGTFFSPNTSIPINEKLRFFLMARMSALVIDLDYQRPESSWRNAEKLENTGVFGVYFCLRIYGGCSDKNYSCDGPNPVVLC